MSKTLCTALITAALSVSAQAQSQGGYHFNQYGVLVNAQGQPANPHQQFHDMANPALWTTGAVAVSNTVDPNYQQANLPTIESAITPNPEPGGQAMSRLYLTPTNPYTPNTGVLGGTPQGYNYDHYQLIMQQAPGSGYAATDSGAYIAKTHPGSSDPLFNWGFHTYENEPDFQAAKAAAGGRGGGIVVTVNQSAESFNHLRAISGSNEYMSVYVRPPSGGVIALGGQVVLNEQHNTSPALDTSQYGPAFVAGVSDYQGQTLATGNETGFWVTGTGSNTQISGWGDGSANSIAASYNPDAQFHVHTHPGSSGPSYTDFLASALLGGMPGMVASPGGNYAYGFQVIGGVLPTPEGGAVTFGDVGWGSTNNPAAAQNASFGGRNAQGYIQSPTQGSTGNALSFGGLLAGKPQATLDGTLGYGGGVSGSTCLGGCTGTTGTIHPVAMGAAGAANISLASVSYNYSGAQNSPVSLSNGFAISGYYGLGGTLNVGWNPAGSFSADLQVGLGVGGAWSIFGVQFGNQDNTWSSTASPVLGGTYGGAHFLGSYSDDGSNYGQGNRSPDGSAINGFSP